MKSWHQEGPALRGGGPACLKSSDLHGQTISVSHCKEGPWGTTLHRPLWHCQLRGCTCRDSCRDSEGAAAWAGLSKCVCAACPQWVRVAGNHLLLCWRPLLIQTFRQVKMWTFMSCIIHYALHSKGSEGETTVTWRVNFWWLLKWKKTYQG